MYTSKTGCGMQDAGLSSRGAPLHPESRILIEPLAIRLGCQRTTTKSLVINPQKGISLIELIMFIVIVSVALAGILLVMNVTTKSSADPLIHKQTLAVAESLLEEIELQDFVSASGVTNTVTLANRATEYHIISNYNNFSMAGITSLNGAAVTSLGNYNASVKVANQALGAIPAASAVLITVAVTAPSGETINAVGYRAAY